MMSKLTITEATIEKHIMEKAPPQAQSIIKRVYLAGMKLIFSPQTHGQMMDEFAKQMQQSNDLAGNLGTDIAHIMLILFQQSKGTMPQGALIPAGAMLLAKTCEYLAETNQAQVDDAVFANALHLMSVALMSKFDKGFAQKMGAEPSGMVGQPAPQPMAPTAAPTAQGA